MPGGKHEVGGNKPPTASGPQPHRDRPYKITPATHASPISKPHRLGNATSYPLPMLMMARRAGRDFLERIKAAVSSRIWSKSRRADAGQLRFCLHELGVTFLETWRETCPQLVHSKKQNSPQKNMLAHKLLSKRHVSTFGICAVADTLRREVVAHAGDAVSCSPNMPLTPATVIA